MLQKFRFTLACTEPGTVRGLGGLELHALFFSFLREVEEEAARELHGAKDKPFALGPLEGAGERRGGSFYLQAGEKYGFTVTSLTGAMYRLLEEVAALWPGREVQLGTGALACVDAGTTRAEDLNYRDLVARARPATTVTLEFLTPHQLPPAGHPDSLSPAGICLWQFAPALERPRPHPAAGRSGPFPDPGGQVPGPDPAGPL